MTYFVCRPEVAAELKSQFPKDNLDDLPGIKLFVKNDQLQDSWAFSSLEVVKKYLDGEITEKDLISLAKLN